MKRNFITLVGLLFIWTCEDVEVLKDNPLDENNPDYVAPSITFTSGPSEGDIITESDILFTWDGNELVTEYRTKVDSGGWSNWNINTNLLLEYLDEGAHHIALQGRYSSGDTSSILSINFIVDAVEGPSLMFFPRVVQTSVNSTVQLKVLAEEVYNLTAVQFNINFDPSKIEIISATQGSMLQISGESIFDVDYDNTVGNISIITAALGGSQPSVEGTGILLEIELNIKSEGTTSLEFDGTEVFRDPDNNDIDISQKVNGMVVVE